MIDLRTTQKPWLKVEEVVEGLQVPKSTVYDWIQKRKIASLAIGGTVRVCASSARDMLNLIEEKHRADAALKAPRIVVKTLPGERIVGVYFVECEGFIKIGSSGNCHNRFIGLLTGRPFHAYFIAVIRTESLADARQMEKELHIRFSSLRVHREWFKKDVPLTSFISELQTELKLERA